MDYNKLANQYLGSAKPYAEIVNEIINRYNHMPVSIDEINRQIAAFAAQSDAVAFVDYTGYDTKLLRRSIIRPIKEITDRDIINERANRSVVARSYLANRIATYSVGLVGGDIADRDVANLLEYESGPDKREDRLNMLKNSDPETKKKFFMTIVNDIEHKLSKVSMNDNLSDEEIIDNISNLDATCQAAVLRAACETFENKYGVTFSEEEKNKIQAVYDKGQDANWNFLNRMGQIANPYYATVDNRDMDRLHIMAESESDKLEFASNDVVRQAMAATGNSYSKNSASITNQAQAFADKHGIQAGDVLYRITHEDGSVSVTRNELTLGIYHAKAITLLTPNLEHSADVVMDFGNSLANRQLRAVEFPAGDLQGKNFAKDCGELFAEMDKVDHWYQRSSDEFRDAKKLLNQITTGKLMSLETANENSKKLVDYADTYIRNHIDKQLNEREQARLNVMIKISRTFHAKRSAYQDTVAQHQRAVEAHNNNRFVSDANRQSIDKQVVEEYNLDRLPHATRGVKELDVKGPETTEEIEARDKKLDEVREANISYIRKKLDTGLDNNYANFYITLGAQATGSLINYAQRNDDYIPDDFKAPEAIALTIISSMIKVERENYNNGYLKNANDNVPTKITPGPFEKFITGIASKDDIVNALVKTDTVKHFCNGITPARVSDMLVNHKELKLAQLVQSELTASALAKSVAAETDLRHEREAKEAQNSSPQIG